MKLFIYLIIGAGSFFLVACGGGSSSTSTSASTPDTPVTPTIASFTSWSDTAANVPVAMTGGFSSSVDLVGNISHSDSSGSATFTRDAATTIR